MTGTDPWAVLGVAPGSSLAEARAARRRLAKQLHPDIHGGQGELAAQMTRVNQALAEIEALVASQAQAAEVPVSVAVAHHSGPADPDSFSVSWLPVDAFEALFLAAYGLGDILSADEPYLLELYLNQPPCFCRLSLVPEAGASLIFVEVSPATDAVAAPQPAAVIDILVAELNALVAR